jgi:NAD(P)-dependent dehydrogenase (short-subunit alcohol dehydrogenase family)
MGAETRSCNTGEFTLPTNSSSKRIHKIGTPEDNAHEVIFLASGKSSYVTGQSIVVDGGWTASS